MQPRSGTGSRPKKVSRMIKASDMKRVQTALGFAKKAGKVRSGEFSAEKSIKNGSALVTVVDASASSQTKKHWADACANAGIPLVEAEDVGLSIGSEAHMVACIVDNGFAQMLLRACNDKEFES